jgi:hypothetical protein
MGGAGDRNVEMSRSVATPTISVVETPVFVANEPAQGRDLPHSLVYLRKAFADVRTGPT